MDADEQFAESYIVFAEESFDPLVRLAQSGDSRLGLDWAHAQWLEHLQIFVRSVPARGARAAYRLRQPIQRGLDASLFAAQPFTRMDELHDEAGFGAGLELDGQIEMLAAQISERFRGAIKFAGVQEFGVPESGDRQDFIGALGEPQQIGGRRARDDGDARLREMLAEGAKRGQRQNRLRQPGDMNDQNMSRIGWH